MRPLPGDDAFARPRSHDNESPSILPLSPTRQHSGPQMTFALGDESTVDVALEHASAILQRPQEPQKLQSHDATSSSGSASSDKAKHKDKERQHPRDEDAPSIMSRPESPSSVRAYAPSNLSNLSQPMTPAMLGTPGPASALSSIPSRRSSFSGSFLDEMGASQVLSVENDEGNGNDVDSMAGSGSAPQLIMPSIKMPSRRPFTDKGKAMSRLKVLIAGDSGVGKTSLVKAIVQTCDHIVHVDPIGPSTGGLPRRSTTDSPAGRRGSKTHCAPNPGTSQIVEIYASTKPYPEWWSDLDESKILRRRRSLDDAVLDRNICFVDTPGYSSSSSAMETISQITQYVESHFRRMSSNTLSEGEQLHMLAGDGGVQVDVVFYLVSKRLKPVDVEYLRQLAPLTNVVVLLAQSDLLTREQISAGKQQVECQLQEAGIKPFCFAISSAPESSSTLHPYAISSALGSDHETMDASLLMSPEYVQPLFQTELTTLVEQVFNPDGIAWLRHVAAKKYIQWRSLETPSAARPVALRNPFSNYGSLANPYSQLQHQQTPLANQVLTPPMGAASSFALARVTDHTQREERLAQIRLANWASDLQRSLANERARFEELARGERAVWLTERLNECVIDGSLVPIRSGREVAPRRSKSARSAVLGAAAHHQQDPLGLIEIAADMRRKGIVALEVLGSLGVLGGVALWLSRNLQDYPWAPPLPEWERLWYGVR